MTTEQIKGAFAVLQAVAETIRELKRVPSGVLYAQLQGKMDLTTYNKIIETLKNTGLVKENNFLLEWIEPAALPVS
jgi:hypothetical protein